MKCHYYDSVTGLYTHSAMAQEDRLASKVTGSFVPMLPAFATLNDLPVGIPVNHVPRFDCSADAWQVVESYIGQVVYSVSDKSELLVVGVGPLPFGYTLLVPGEFECWQVDKWVRDDAAYFSDLLQKKTAELNGSCANAITAGFISSALGSDHRYSSALDDQLNISGNVLAATLGDTTYHACYDVNNLRDFREHTSAQMIQVGRDLSAHKMTCLQLATALKLAAEAAVQAQDEAALAAISWV